MAIPLKAYELVEFPGRAGERHTPTGVADALGVPYGTVLEWLWAGWLKGHFDPTTQRWWIRRKAIRRALRDYPAVAATVAYYSDQRDGTVKKGAARKRPENEVADRLERGMAKSRAG